MYKYWSPRVEWGHSWPDVRRGGWGWIFTLENSIVIIFSITHMQALWHWLILNCWTVAPVQSRAAHGVQSLMPVYMNEEIWHSWSSWEMQCSVCIITTKSFSYERGSILSIRLTGPLLWPLGLLLTFCTLTVTLFRFPKKWDKGDNLMIIVFSICKFNKCLMWKNIAPAMLYAL